MANHFGNSSLFKISENPASNPSSPFSSPGRRQIRSATVPDARKMRQLSQAPDPVLTRPKESVNMLSKTGDSVFNTAVRAGVAEELGPVEEMKNLSVTHSPRLPIGMSTTLEDGKASSPKLPKKPPLLKKAFSCDVLVGGGSSSLQRRRSARSKGAMKVLSVTMEEQKPVRATVTVRPSYEREDETTKMTGSHITNGLYVGPETAAYNKEWLQLEGITRILSFVEQSASDRKPAVGQPSDYLHLPCQDKPKEDISRLFDKAHEFIDLALKTNQRILIHCQAGISRSGTVAISYLMKRYFLTLKEAYAFAKNRRLKIQPNRGFFEQLQNYENTLYGAVSMTKEELSSGLFWCEADATDVGDIAERWTLPSDN
eukprot:scpid59630/ scgid16100/ Serine/threonine/tyrosine-interacting protein B